ncbi:MAG: hypothetical protein NTX33_17785 [Propionibacteriales bacterium]|nr:hypothetical protein [Propionibacteriales bacterium]
MLVLGSQSILGTFTEDELPEKAHASIEADVTFFNDYENDKSDVVDMHLGEDSQFHATFGYYAQGVNVEVAVLPTGWQDRVVVLTSPSTNGASGHCLEPHDLVVAKLVAGRMKDLEFADALLHAKLIAPDTLVARAQMLEQSFDTRRVVGWVIGWTAKHGPCKPAADGHCAGGSS